MPLITATSAVDLMRIDLYALTSGASSRTLTDNAFATSAQGYVYEDLLRVDSPQGRAEFGGGSLLVDGSGMLTNGWLSGFLAYTPGSSSFTPWYSIEGFSVAAVTVQNAANTVSTTDDLALWTSVLGGSDIFNLSADADRAQGYAGNDTMRGFGGNDTLLGGEGIDSLLGGDGNDSLHGGAMNDSLFGGAGSDTLNGGATPGLLDTDRMEGGAGNDTYIVDIYLDFVVELAGGGVDTVQSSADFTLPNHVEKLVLTGIAGRKGVGNDLANTLTGNAGANELVGLGGNDVLVGNAGNDTLDGRLGNDSMLGGLGNDLYFVDSPYDRVGEAAASGIDTVRSTVNHALAVNVENLQLQSGVTPINGAGNTLNNLMTGNGVANKLSGGAGNDTLDGFVGNDTLTGGTGADSFRFSQLGNPWNNLDRVIDFSSVDDRILIDNDLSAGYRTVGPNGALATAAFRLGTKAADASDRIIYNKTTGAMYYDSDGTGLGVQLQFAQFNPGTTVTLADLFVI